MADCPECEYCCAIGLCCSNPADQHAALVKIFLREGSTPAEADKHATAIVNAKQKADK